MNTLDFLNLVWPSTGHYLIAIPSQYVDHKNNGKVTKFFKHFAFTTIADAANYALALANDRDTPSDVFFALGTVKEDLTHVRKDDREALGKKVRGIHRSGFDNTQALKAYWLDLDVDMAKASTGQAYATREDAAAGLRGFCQAMGLPRPYVTSSGGGFHAYWPLTEPLDPDQWQHYANILRQLSDSWGLRADPSRTADRASVLRPLGTHNWKTGQPRTVVLAVTGVVTDTQQFLKRLAFLAETMSLPPVEPRHVVPQIPGTLPQLVAGQGPSVEVLNEQAAHGAGYELPDPRKVVANCPQLSWQAANQALVPEPLWYAMIGCLRHAKDGVKAIHFMSRQSPTYDAGNTDAKIAQHANGGFGPTTCAVFEQHNPTGCQGCPFKGKIKTPLATVRELKQVAPPTVQLQLANGTQAQVALPPPPKPFKRVTNPLTGSARLAMTVGDAKTGSQQDEIIYEYDLFPTRLIFDERENGYNVVINRWLPQDGWMEFSLPTGKLYDRKQLAITFGSIGVWPDVGMVDNVVQYMLAYIRDLQKVAQSNVVYAQLGWRLDQGKFILPDRVVTANGVEAMTPSRNVLNTLGWRDPRGDLETWKKIAAVYERPGMEAHQFGFGVGFASPLFAFTNFNGMIVSMVGRAGAGKSSSAMMANSVWGHPKMGWADAEHDTQRAFYQKLGVLKNLPATYDEHTNLEGELISDLCYAVSKGQGRQRLRGNAEAMENHGNYQLMMLMTGNTSLNSRLAVAKADASAESARVFEYEVPANTLSKAEADLYWGPGGQLDDNFGLAGPVYAQQLLASQDWAKDRIRHWVRAVDQAGQVSSGERFWSAGVACVLVGFELANACGLTNCDIDRLFQFAVRVIQDMRTVVTENTRSPVGAISEYFNSNLRSALIVNSDGTATSPPVMLHEPSDRLRIRYEKHRGVLYLDRADFNRFCGQRQVDAKALGKELLRLGVLRGTNTKLTLGKGTIYSGMQTICWVVDMKHPEVLGAGEFAPVAAAPAPTTGAQATP